MKNSITLPNFTDFHGFFFFLQIGKKKCITLPDHIDFPLLPCQPVFSPGMTEISLLQMESKYDDIVCTDNSLR